MFLTKLLRTFKPMNTDTPVNKMMSLNSDRRGLHVTIPAIALIVSHHCEGFIRMPASRRNGGNKRLQHRYKHEFIAL